MNNKGFTLAEVLITLGIIGVVAAITLPTLMQNGSKQQLGTKLAKFSSNVEKIARAAAVESTLERQDLWEILGEEMLFIDNSSLLGSYEGGTESNLVTLRDGTQFKFSSTDGLAYPVGDGSKYGYSIAKIEFFPNISGLSGGPTSFFFSVTNKGFVFPDVDDKCLSLIYDKKYKATKVYGVESDCTS